MALKVPSYNGPQVQEQALPGVRQSTVASAKLLGGGEVAQEVGETLQRGGAALAEVAGKIQDRENVDAVFRAETTFKEELIRFDTEQRTKKGAAALADGGITEQSAKWFGENVQRHADGLTNPVQQRAFQRMAEGARLSTLESHSKYQAVQAQASVTDSTNATIVGSINRAVANANDWTILEAERGEITRRVDVLAKLNGYDKAKRDMEVGEKLTVLHKQMVQQLVKTNPAAVKAYFDKYESEIDGTQRAEIGAYATKATAVSVGSSTADAVWKSDGPKSRTDPVKLADMEERLRTTLKGNDEAIDNGIKELRSRVQSYNVQVKSEANALEAGVNGLILGGASSSAVRKSPEFLKLSAQAPEEARKVMSFMENQEYTRVARANAAEGLAYTRERREQERLHTRTLDTTLRLSNPTVLAAMSRDEIVNLLPTLGSTSTQGLLAKYDSFIKNPEKLIEARIDKQDFDTMALGAGFRPNESKKSEEEKNRLVRLQAQVENAIDAEQRKTGKALPREAKQVIMQKQIDDAVILQRYFSKNESRPISTITPDEMKDAFVEVGPTAQRVKVSEISPTFRAQAVQARNAQGLPTTEKQLAELWLRSKNQYKDK